MEKKTTKIWWKDGFHDQPVDGGVEISSDLWQKLLHANTREGKNIITGPDGFPIAVDPIMSIDEIRDIRLSELSNYDKGPAFNFFTLNGKKMWLDKATRTSLAYSLNIEESEGKTQTRIWFVEIPEYMDLPIVEVRKMLADVEEYAKKTFTITQTHKQALYGIEAIDELQNYNVYSGYPAPLVFTI